MNLVCVTSNSMVGCTFLDWTVHFLAGQTDFLHVRKGVIPLVFNPLDKTNAHGHIKNHPGGLIQTQNVIEILKKQNRLTSFYPFPWQLDLVAKHLKMNQATMTPTQWKTCIEYQITDYNQLLYKSHTCGAKIIFTASSEQTPLYHLNIRTLSRMPLQAREAESVSAIKQEIDQAFFSDSIKAWNKINLTNLWDKRERQALCTRPFHNSTSQVDLCFPHYWLDSQTLWYDFDREVVKIMDWLQLPIVPERFQLWLPIYQEWQKIQIDALQFQYNCKHIVESIVNNWFYKIDLTFDQEVVVQHCLIYHYNLNLKTWRLEKFPNNTQDLHKLLEPNLHPVPDLYSRLATQVY